MFHALGHDVDSFVVVENEPKKSSVGSPRPPPVRGAVLRTSGAGALVATDGPANRRRADNLQKGCCTNVSSGFADRDKITEADIEDLIEPSVFDALVRDAYKVELKNKELTLNAEIPRIVKRYEVAFAAIGLEFYKTRAARLFLAEMAKKPEKVMPAAAIERFELLFTKIAKSHAKLTTKVAAPFS